MESPSKGMTVQAVYQKKVTLLEELLECLALERDSLVNLNIQNLWDLMENKQRLLTSIEEVQEQSRDIKRGQAREERPSLESVALLARKISRLKDEIGTRVKENVSFIQDTLGFFDELISMVITGRHLEPAYSPVKRTSTGQPNPIYHREV